MEAFFPERVGEIISIDAKQDKSSIEHCPLKLIILVCLFQLFPLFRQGFLLRFLALLRFSSTPWISKLSLPITSEKGGKTNQAPDTRTLLFYYYRCLG